MREHEPGLVVRHELLCIKKEARTPPSKIRSLLIGRRQSVLIHLYAVSRVPRKGEIPVWQFRTLLLSDFPQVAEPSKGCRGQILLNPSAIGDVITLAEGVHSIELILSLFE